MANIGVGQKLRVFISSKCGGRYTIVRTAIKNLFETTGLIETYVYERAPASGEDNVSAYLDSIDKSDLCIFLIDNADGASSPVLNEEKRAISNNLIRIYLFCDQDRKEPTPLQIEVQKTQSCKYKTVHEFSDFIAEAYNSVMQDLVFFYRRKMNRMSEEAISTSSSADPASITGPSTETYSLPKDRFSFSDQITRGIKSGLIPSFPSENETKPTNLEVLLGEQLSVVLNRKAFHEDCFISLKEEILNAQDLTAKDLIEKRLNAQLYYFQSKYEECLDLLQEALRDAVSNKSIPTWLANDIAIDIRHVVIRIDDSQNAFSLDNPGQKFIDESSETVFYPLLDRQVENMHEAIANHYHTAQTASPYSTQFGGFNEIFTSLANAFCIAQMHGSIVQTIICKERLISILSMLCTLFEDHEFVVELARLLVTKQDSKSLDALIRTYNQSSEIINDTDIAQILDSISYITDQLQQYKSKYLLASRLGYYMNDNQYQDLYTDLIHHSSKWIQKDVPVLSLSSFVFDFYRENTHRSDLDLTIAFISAVFDSKKAMFYPECYKVLNNIDYSCVSLKGQRRTRELLESNLKSMTNDEHGLLSACTRFCKSATVPYKRIENSISKKSPRFYKDSFCLEMSLVRKDDPLKYISIYLAEADARNHNQGKDGHYSGYTYEPYDIIFKLISYTSLPIDDAVLASILSSLINTLSEEKQTVSAKISAISLIHLLFYKNTDSPVWEQYKKQIIQNKDVYSSSYEFDFFRNNTSSVLSFTYDLLISSFSSRHINQVIEDIFCLDQQDTLSIVRALSTLSEYLEAGLGSIINKTILVAFLHFSVLMTHHKERDIKYYATTCLIGLSVFEAARDLAVIHLSQIMNSGSQAVKIAILTRIGNTDIDNEDFVEQIFNKGKADNNYLVRYIANREYSEYKKL